MEKIIPYAIRQTSETANLPDSKCRRKQDYIMRDVARDWARCLGYMICSADQLRNRYPFYDGRGNELFVWAIERSVCTGKIQFSPLMEVNF